MYRGQTEPLFLDMTHINVATMLVFGLTSITNKEL